MFEVPYIMGGSWFSAGESNARQTFKINIINKQPNPNTHKIFEDLKHHFNHNEHFSVNIGEDCNYQIVILDENTIEGDKYSKNYTDFHSLEKRIQSMFYYHLMNLAIKYIELQQEHKNND